MARFDEVASKLTAKNKWAFVESFSTTAREYGSLPWR